MSTLQGRFDGQARAIASSTTQPDEVTVRRLSRAARSRRVTRALVVSAVSVVAVGVVGLAGVAAFEWVTEDPAVVMSPAPTPSETTDPAPSTTVEPSPDPEPAATAAPLDGYAPVPHLPRDAIDWDGLAPGWFLVDWRSADDEEWTGVEQLLRDPAMGGLSLVSPSGEWFAVTTHAELSPGRTMAWDGERVWMMQREGGTNLDSLDGLLDVLHLRSGVWDYTTADEAREDTSLLSGYIEPAVDAVMSLTWGGDGMSMQGVGADDIRSCTFEDGFEGYSGTTADDMSFLLDPSGLNMICLRYAAGGQADLVVTPVLRGPEAETAVTFRRPPGEYVFLGWESESRILVARRDQPSWEGSVDGVFRWDMDTREVQELDLPSLLGPSRSTFYEPDAGRFVTVAESADRPVVRVSDFSDALVAEIAMDCRSPQDASVQLRPTLSVSGERLFVVCQSTGEARLYDTTSGGLVGEWQLGEGRTIVPFDYPSWRD